MRVGPRFPVRAGIVPGGAWSVAGCPVGVLAGIVLTILGLVSQVQAVTCARWNCAQSSPPRRSRCPRPGLARSPARASLCSIVWEPRVRVGSLCHVHGRMGQPGRWMKLRPPLRRRPAGSVKLQPPLPARNGRKVAVAGVRGWSRFHRAWVRRPQGWLRFHRARARGGRTPHRGAGATPSAGAPGRLQEDGNR